MVGRKLPGKSYGVAENLACWRTASALSAKCLRPHQEIHCSTVGWELERTGNDLGALKVLVGVKVARREGEPEPDQDQKEVCPPPHDNVFIWRVAAGTGGGGGDVDRKTVGAFAGRKIWARDEVEAEVEDASGASLGDAGAGKGRRFRVEQWHDGMERKKK